MKAVANLTVAGLIKGKTYSVLGMNGGYVRIQLSNGDVVLRHIKAFNLIVD